MGILVRLLEYVPAVDDELAVLAKEGVRLLTELTRLATVLFTSRLVLYLLAAVILYKLYEFFFVPLRYVRRQHDVGYLTRNEKQTAEQRSVEVSRRRDLGDLPPVYPNGWYELCRASDLKAGSVLSITALGREFCVFRGESGTVGVLDAYCPHLGANIAAGGTVSGDCVQCPFHGWKFDQKGTCTEIPYAKEVPLKASTKCYTHHEINDQILLWFDAEGREPTWYPPVLEGVQSGSWSYRGVTLHTINAHIQEVPENAADVAHLNFLHGPILIAGTDLRKTHSKLTFLQHGWEASWAPCEEEGKKHMSVLKLLHYITIFGYRVKAFDLLVTATQIGPALVYLTWRCFAGEGVFVQSLTPEEPLLQCISHRVYCSSTVPTIMAKFYMGGEAKQVERDVMVWNNKRYRGKPLLAKEDQLIARHRRWYSQFYSENSPRYDNAQSLEW